MKTMRTIIALFAITIALTIQPLKAQDSNLASRLKTLTSNYEQKIIRALKPIHKSHLEALKELEQNYTRAADLDTAIQVRREHDRIKAWQDSIIATLHSSPGNKGQPSDLGAWLPGKTYKFQGNAGVITTLKFQTAQVSYSASGIPPKNYDYKITGDLELTIYGQQPWKVQFRKNFQGGTFQSTRGKYDLEYTAEN